MSDAIDSNECRR